MNFQLIHMYLYFQMNSTFQYYYGGSMQLFHHISFCFTHSSTNKIVYLHIIVYFLAGTIQKRVIPHPTCHHNMCFVFCSIIPRPQLGDYCGRFDLNISTVSVVMQNILFFVLVTFILLKNFSCPSMDCVLIV